MRETLRRIGHFLACYFTILLGMALILAPFVDWSKAREVWWGARAGIIFVGTVLCAFMHMDAIFKRKP